MIADALYRLALSTLASTAAIALILVLRKPLRARFGAHAAYAAWALVPLAAAMALLPPPTMPDLPIVAPAPVASASVQSIALAPAPATPFDPLPWFALAWLFGAVACVLLFARQQRRFVRSLGNLAPDGDRTFLAQTTAGCPALVGAWRPRIVLPADFAHRYDSTERALILAHERAHRARGDAQANALAAALRCLYWFNPFFHFAASRFRFDQELACDANVISRFPEARRSYADAMLKTQLADLGLPAGCHWQSSHPLKERIAMLKKPLPGRARAALGLGLAVALVVGGSYAAWAAQPAQSVAPKSSASAVQTEGDIAISVENVPPGTKLFRATSSAVTVLSGDRKHTPELSDLIFMTKVGESFSMEIQHESESWNIDGNVQLVSGDDIEIDATLKHNGAVAGHPRLIMRSGEPASFRIGDGKDGKYKGFAPQFTFREVKQAKQVQSESNNEAGVGYRSMTRIAYPPSAIAAKTEGVVYIGARIGTDGKVVDAKVNTAMSKAGTDLANAALTAVKTWTFEPRKVDGKAVASDTTVAIAFSLDPEKPVEVKMTPDSLDAIRVSPPQDDALARADAPATENVEYRRTHPPRYPPSAIRAKEQGDVVLKVHVDARGNPVEASVAKTIPPNLSPDLGNAAIAAVMHWKFNPAREHGKTIDGWVNVPITFSLTEP